jgi:hypothetical protein
VSGERWVVLGLAQARAPWFRQLAHWAHSAVLPVELVKCVSADELRARLASGRPFSALLADAAVPAVDRDLLALAAERGCVAFVVDDVRVRRDWRSIGAAAVLPPDFTRDDLLAALGQHARPVARSGPLPGDAASSAPPEWRGRVVAVTGPGGTGASACAIALAQGLAAAAGGVVLADLQLHAEQAMLHDTRDVVPGLEELVESHRRDRPPPAEVRALTFLVAERGYHLLLGLRRARHWAAVGPRAFATALDGLAAAFGTVVADVGCDLEGEDESGSADVEERNAMARTTMAAADAVCVVGEPSMKGLHALARVLHDLHAFGVPATRVLPVFNRAGRSPRARAGLARALADVAPEGAFPSPVFLPERHVDEALRDGVRLPDALATTLAGAVRAVAERSGPRALDGDA